jgi:hypothetical protein
MFTSVFDPPMKLLATDFQFLGNRLANIRDGDKLFTGHVDWWRAIQ